MAQARRVSFSELLGSTSIRKRFVVQTERVEDALFELADVVPEPLIHVVGDAR